MQTFKVSAVTRPGSLAGAVAGVVRKCESVEIQAIGAAAVNQATKAIVIARGFVAPHGIELVCVPAFLDVEINGEDRTAIKFMIEAR